MGITVKELLVKKDREAEAEKIVEFLIDSGAIYSLVPAEILRELNIKAYKKVKFYLVDGTTIEKKVGDAYYEYNGEGGAAPVIFGEEGDSPLLGATTLESMGLVLNPFTRELYQMRMLLM